MDKSDSSKLKFIVIAPKDLEQSLVELQEIKRQHALLLQQIHHLSDGLLELQQELKQARARSLLWKTAAKRWRRNALVMTETVLAMARDANLNRIDHQTMGDSHENDG